MYSGAKRNVICDSQAKPYTAGYVVTSTLRKSKRADYFENSRHRGLGTLDIYIPVSHSHILRFEA